MNSILTRILDSCAELLVRVMLMVPAFFVGWLAMRADLYTALAVSVVPITLYLLIRSSNPVVARESRKTALICCVVWGVIVTITFVYASWAFSAFVLGSDLLSKPKFLTDVARNIVLITSLLFVANRIYHTDQLPCRFLLQPIFQAAIAIAILVLFEIPLVVKAMQDVTHWKQIVMSGDLGEFLEFPKMLLSNIVANPQELLNWAISRISFGDGSMFSILPVLSAVLLLITLLRPLGLIFSSRFIPSTDDDTNIVSLSALFIMHIICLGLSLYLPGQITGNDTELYLVVVFAVVWFASCAVTCTSGIGFVYLFWIFSRARS